MHFIFALLLVSGTALANDRIGDYHTWNDETSYLAWCEDNQVMSQDSTGRVFVQIDCNESQQICREKNIRRAQRLIVTAACFNQ
ncbi:MAG: hypothetical protein ACLGG0_01695 [Bacteriovoracia bacterium]